MSYLSKTMVIKSYNERIHMVVLPYDRRRIEGPTCPLHIYTFGRTSTHVHIRIPLQLKFISLKIHLGSLLRVTDTTLVFPNVFSCVFVLSFCQ